MNVRRPVVWYWPAWRVTRPWRLWVSRGGDEWCRRTLLFEAGPLGALVVADPRASAGFPYEVCALGERRDGEDWWCVAESGHGGDCRLRPMQA